MKIFAINGSPRKKGNTATVLTHAVAGASEAGAETELIHLTEYTFSGCKSCFACKKIDGKSHGRCALKDDLTQVLQRLHTEASALIVGAPVYFSTASSLLAAFNERLYFPYFTYNAEKPSSFPRSIPSGHIFTMNVTEEQAKEWHYDITLAPGPRFAQTIFGQEPLIFKVYNTYQFSDYSKYDSSVFSEPDKARWRDEHFPQDCQQAFSLGRTIAQSTGIRTN